MWRPLSLVCIALLCVGVASMPAATPGTTPQVPGARPGLFRTPCGKPLAECRCRRTPPVVTAPPVASPTPCGRPQAQCDCFYKAPSRPFYVPPAGPFYTPPCKPFYTPPGTPFYAK